ncbi:hypothetical protein Tco_1245294 [Tanacetum coccineum]
MAVLESCPKHNMVAYLEKTEGNAEFHEVIDFLRIAPFINASTERKVHNTPLLASMLVQPTKDEGATLERPSESQPTPSPPHPSEANVEPQSEPSPRPSPSTHIPDSIPESSGGNHGDQAKEIKHLKAQIKKLKKKAKPVITHHRAWMKSVSLKKRLAGKKSKESVSKQGRKSAKAEPSVHKDPLL